MGVLEVPLVVYSRRVLGGVVEYMLLAISSWVVGGCRSRSWVVCGCRSRSWVVCGCVRGAFQ